MTEKQQLPTKLYTPAGIPQHISYGTSINFSKLDNRSKKNLIIKLTESINPNDNNDFDLASLYGAWDDDRTSDEIIRDIKASRIDKQDSINFE